MHDVNGFRRAWQSLTRQQVRTIEGRCKGLGNKGVAAEMGITIETVKNHVWNAFQILREAGVLTNETTVMDRVCWRLGYEQALSDIEQRVKRKQAA